MHMKTVKVDPIVRSRRYDCYQLRMTIHFYEWSDKKNDKRKVTRGKQIGKRVESSA